METLFRLIDAYKRMNRDKSPKRDESILASIPIQEDTEEKVLDEEEKSQLMKAKLNVIQIFKLKSQIHKTEFWVLHIDKENNKRFIEVAGLHKYWKSVTQVASGFVLYPYTNTVKVGQAGTEFMPVAPGMFDAEVEQEVPTLRFPGRFDKRELVVEIEEAQDMLDAFNKATVENEELKKKLEQATNSPEINILEDRATPATKIIENGKPVVEDRYEGSGYIKVHLNKIGNAKEKSAIRIDDYPAIIFPDGKVIEFSGKKWEINHEKTGQWMDKRGTSDVDLRDAQIRMLKEKLRKKNAEINLDRNGKKDEGIEESDEENEGKASLSWGGRKKTFTEIISGRVFRDHVSGFDKNYKGGPSQFVEDFLYEYDQKFQEYPEFKNDLFLSAVFKYYSDQKDRIPFLEKLRKFPENVRKGVEGYTKFEDIVDKFLIITRSHLTPDGVFNKLLKISIKAEEAESSEIETYFSRCKEEVQHLVATMEFPMGTSKEVKSLLVDQLAKLVFVMGLPFQIQAHVRMQTNIKTVTDLIQSVVNYYSAHQGIELQKRIRGRVYSVDKVKEFCGFCERTNHVEEDAK